MMTHRPSSPSLQGGMTLLEVLITLLVFSIGLMGSASMQVTGLRLNQSAHLRTLAVIQAYDLADRIRANQAGVAAGAYDSISNTPANPGCATNGCSPEQIAQLDIHEWNTTNARDLPLGGGSVERQGGDVFRIRVMWKDERNDGHGSDCVDEDLGALSCFTLEFQP